MRHFTILMLAALALLSLSCDRFDHAFEPVVEANLQQELFTPLQTALVAVPTAGLDPVMNYFADEYLHFGITKSDRRAWLESLVQTAGLEIAVELVNSETLSETTGVATWRLRVTDPDGKAVLADSLFTGDNLAKTDGVWQLKGNRVACPPPTPKQHVVIEYFTFLGCPNCPPVEARLHELELAYPNQVSYIEQHINEPLAIYGDDSFAYYGFGNVPASVVQGQTSLLGSGQAILDEYTNQVETLTQLNTAITYQIVSAEIVGSTVQATVDLNVLAQDFDQSNLWLYYALIEKESSYSNTQGQHLRNVMRARGRKDLSATDLSLPVSFSLQSLANPAIPDDPALVIFAQTRPATFANNAVIHSGIEIPLTPPAKKAK